MKKQLLSMVLVISIVFSIGLIPSYATTGAVTGEAKKLNKKAWLNHAKKVDKYADDMIKRGKNIVTYHAKMPDLSEDKIFRTITALENVTWGSINPVTGVIAGMNAVADAYSGGEISSTVANLRMIVYGRKLIINGYKMKAYALTLKKSIWFLKYVPFPSDPKYL